MKFKPCPLSFFTGVLASVLLGVLVLVQSPSPKAPALVPVSADSAPIPPLPPGFSLVHPVLAYSSGEYAPVMAIDNRQVKAGPWVRYVAPKAAHSTYTVPAHVAENGSYFAQPNAHGVPKTVKVNGYFRRDGTYVRGHYRSAPGTNP